MPSLRAAAVAFIASIFFASPGWGKDTAVDLELVLAVDISRSIDSEEADLQRSGYSTALTDPQVIRAIESGFLGKIAIVYVEWAGNGHQEIVVPWTVISDWATAKSFAEEIEDAPPIGADWTAIGAAIDYCAGLFADNGFDSTRQVIDLSGDGPTNKGPSATGARDRAVAKGITINGLAILEEKFSYKRLLEPDMDLYFRDNVMGGPGGFVVVAKGYLSFSKAILNKLIREIAATEPRSIRTASARSAAGPDYSR